MNSFVWFSTARISDFSQLSFVSIFRVPLCFRFFLFKEDTLFFFLLPQRFHTPQIRTDKTKDVLLAAKDRRIKALEAENRKLKEELKTAFGKLYERVL
jgi:hypothetical protein